MLPKALSARPSQLKMSEKDGVTPTSSASNAPSPCAFFVAFGLAVRPPSPEWSSERADPRAEARSTACQAAGERG